MPNISSGTLNAAVEQGIVTAEQADALRVLERGDSGGALHAETARSHPGAAHAHSRESRSGFNWTSIAYGAGALAVVFAFGWFLIDRWRTLGPEGVLVVIAVYAAVFIVATRLLRREGFELAAGVSALLAVMLTPIAAWAIQRLLGVWPAPVAQPRSGFYLERPHDQWESVRWIVLSLSTMAAALVAIRALRFPLLSLPVVSALICLPQLLLWLLMPEPAGMHSRGWLLLSTGGMLLAVAYSMERRNSAIGQLRTGAKAGVNPFSAGDHAFWYHLGALFAASAGMLILWDGYPENRHLAPVFAVMAATLSLTLRRPMYLIFGAAGFMGWLGYVTFDVFRNSTAFPIVLATFGILIILATVWLQRSYPRLVAAAHDDPAGAHAWIPWGWASIAVAIAFPLLMLGSAIPLDLAMREHERTQSALMRSAKWREISRKAMQHQADRERAERAERTGRVTPPPAVENCPSPPCRPLPPL
jgi:hypothetical protein